MKRLLLEVMRLIIILIGSVWILIMNVIEQLEPDFNSITVHSRLLVHHYMCTNLLLLDETVASRAVFVIVSGSDGWKRFWSELNNSKTVRDRPYVSFGS